MDDASPPPGSTADAAWKQRLAAGPYLSSPDDRIYKMRIKMIGDDELTTPAFRARLARLGELVSCGFPEDDKNWELVELRTSTAMMADLERIADENGYALVVLRKLRPFDDIDWEVINLSTATTGVPGVIAISCGAYGMPHVGWSKRAGRGAEGAFTVPISMVGIATEPGTGELVERWVRHNHDALRRYWYVGESWTHEEVKAFVADLKPVIATCTFCGQRQAIIQIGKHVAWCVGCKPRPREPGAHYECPFDVYEREQAAGRRDEDTDSET